jgi:glycosyltransferase involved in cell wall biosynthesis
MSHLVSIIIPTYSRSNELDRTIKSCLSQSHGNIEIIIVDDNGIKSIFQKINEKLINEKYTSDNIKYIINDLNRGGSYSRNIGVENSLGKYLCFLDDDDSFEPKKVEHQLSYLIKNPNYIACYCWYDFYNHSTKIKSYEPKDEGNLTYEILTYKNSVCAGSTLMIKKKIFETVGGFDESFKRHQDWEFLLCLFRKGFKIGLVKEQLVRIHRESRINEGSLEEYISFKSVFLNKFKKDIETSVYKDEILMYQSLDLSLRFFKDKYYNEGFSHLKKANNYKFIGIKNILRVFKSILA